MFVRKMLYLVILSTSVALAGCGNSNNKAALTGVIAHTHRISIPADYVITIRIEDTTTADAPGKMIAEQVIKNQAVALPMPFAIVYDPRKINPDHMYSLHAEILDNTGKLLYTNVTSVPVLTHGNPTRDVKVTVVLPNE
jgi:putative lipoprotein